MSLLRRIAAKAPVRVFAAIGAHARDRVENLTLRPGIERVSSPRHANVLLVAGPIPDELGQCLSRVHDQLPHPRASLCWGASPPSPLRAAVSIDGDESPAAALHALSRALWLGRRDSEPDLLPDEPPAPWRGRGDHGQGGEGMMGGKPYGRPMAMTGEDLRDGLALDVHTLEVGPFLPALAPGLVLRLTLQGDVIAHAEALHRPFPDGDDFGHAPSKDISIAQLEQRRAAHHLRSMARLLTVRGLPWHAAQCLRAAKDIAADSAPAAIASLARLIRRSGFWRALPRGWGRLDADAAHGADMRRSLDVYRQLGFRPLTEPDCDVHARARLWLREAAQSVALAQRAGTRATAPIDDASTPASAAGPHETLGRLLCGHEWHEAVTVLASFDAAALQRMVPDEARA